MHELGITQGIIDRACEAAVANEMLTGEDEFFTGARLYFEHRPVAATCLSCSDEFSTDAPHPICPQCGSLMVQLDPEAPMVQLTDVDIDDGSDGKS